MDLIAACEGLLAFIRERYPQDFVEGGRGYVCPHHIAIAKALEGLSIPVESLGREKAP